MLMGLNNMNGRDRPANGKSMVTAPAKPGVLTSELWSVVFTVGAAVASCLTAEDRTVQLAALGAMTLLGCVLGGLYIWSRTRVKTSRP